MKDPDAVANVILRNNRRNRIPPPTETAIKNMLFPRTLRICDLLSRAPRDFLIENAPLSLSRERIPINSAWALSARPPQTLRRLCDLLLFPRVMRSPRGFLLCAHNQLSVDRQSNCVSDIRCGPTVMRKYFGEPSLRLNRTSCSISISRPIASFIGDKALELTPNSSRIFQMLGLVETNVVRRDIVREAIKFLGYAPQYLFHVRLDGHFRQSPSVVGLCPKIG